MFHLFSVRQLADLHASERKGSGERRAGSIEYMHAVMSGVYEVMSEAGHALAKWGSRGTRLRDGSRLIRVRPQTLPSLVVETIQSSAATGRFDLVRTIVSVPVGPCHPSTRRLRRRGWRLPPFIVWPRSRGCVWWLVTRSWGMAPLKSVSLIILYAIPVQIIVWPRHIFLMFLPVIWLAVRNWDRNACCRYNWWTFLNTMLPGNHRVLLFCLF